MVFIDNPNLPENDVCLAVAGDKLDREAEDRLKSFGVGILRMPPHKHLYPAVAGHPDMLLHHICGNTLVYAPGTEPALLDALAAYGFRLVMGESALKPSYPADIAYNVARVGRLYFHNLKYTDPILKQMLANLDIEPVHVEQGYTKCSILPVGNDSIATSDAGIAKAAEKKGLDVLLVDYERSIRLPGLNYGFIGGAAGMIGKSRCALNGNVRKLDCYEAFSSFMNSKNIEIVELSDGHATDIGSVLPLLTL